MRKLALIAAIIFTAGILPTPALARVSVATATRLDRSEEAGFWGTHRHDMQLDCRQGPRGNVGCDYAVCVNFGSDSASNGSTSVTLDFGAVLLYGHDAVVRRHGRLRVLVGPWMRVGRRCR